MLPIVRSQYRTGRRFAIGALLTAVLFLLAACTSASVLTDSGTTTEPKGKTVPPVAFQQVSGIPPSRLSDLKTAMAVAGGQRDIGIVEGQAPSGSFSLAGEFRAFSDSAGVRIIYQWQLRDADGVLIQSIDGEDNAGLASGSDPWALVTPAVIERIARRTTEAMATKLSELGYATRLSALKTPPSEYFASAGPGANLEIDFETLNGPGLAMAGADFLTAGDPTVAVAAVDPDSEGARGEEAAAAQPQPVPPPSPTTAAADPATSGKTASKKEGKIGIRAVAVVPVKGSPGNGDAELTTAMRKTLSSAGWPVVTERRPDALTVVGRVEVAAKGASTQTVMVRWDVQAPDGKSLGDVKQRNDVPAGSLDKGWGSAALAVAEGAATGIFDIVKRLQ